MNEMRKVPGRQPGKVFEIGRDQEDPGISEAIGDRELKQQLQKMLAWPGRCLQKNSHVVLL